MAEQARPALEHVMTGPIAEEAVVCSNTRAAANTIVNFVADAALLVRAASCQQLWQYRAWRSHMQADDAATVSIVPKIADTTAAAVDSAGHEVVRVSRPRQLSESEF